MNTAYHAFSYAFRRCLKLAIHGLILVAVLAIAALCVAPARGADLDLEGVMPAFELPDMGLPAAPPAQEKSPLRLKGSMWCTEKSEGAPGCDLGVGMALYTRGRASLVAAVGPETLGAGLAWRVGVTDAGRVVAVAIGAAIEISPDGFETDDVHLAIGATMSLRGGR